MYKIGLAILVSGLITINLSPRKEDKDNNNYAS